MERSRRGCLVMHSSGNSELAGIGANLSCTVRTWHRGLSRGTIIATEASCTQISVRMPVIGQELRPASACF